MLTRSDLVSIAIGAVGAAAIDLVFGSHLVPTLVGTAIGSVAALIVATLIRRATR